MMFGNIYIVQHCNDLRFNRVANTTREGVFLPHRTNVKGILQYSRFNLLRRRLLYLFFHSPSRFFLCFSYKQVHFKLYLVPIFCTPRVRVMLYVVYLLLFASFRLLLLPIQLCKQTERNSCTLMIMMPIMHSRDDDDQ